MLRHDVGPALTDLPALIRHLESNPIAAWIGGRGTGDQSFFSYQDQQFSSRIPFAPELREALQELTRELAEWRLAEYLSRPDLATVAPESFACKVLHSGGKPSLFLPDRAKHPNLPAGSDGIQGVNVHAFGDPIDQPNYRGY